MEKIKAYRFMFLIYIVLYLNYIFGNENITNITANPIPIADFTLLDTPKNGHTPKYFVSIILFISTADINNVTSSILFHLLSIFIDVE